MILITDNNYMFVKDSSSYIFVKKLFAMKKRYLLILLIALASCSPYTNSQYFQGLDRNPELNHKVNNFTPITIQVGDEIGLNVKSLSPEGSAIFNTGGVVSDNANSNSPES